jgi:hypothetical protein
LLLAALLFCGSHLLWAQLRTSDKGGAHGTLAIFHYLAERIKKAWPHVKIILRGDAGFYSAKLLNYCERYGYGYILGFPSNVVLKRISASVVCASKLFFMDRQPQEAVRLFDEYQYKCRHWKRPRRIIVKAERLPDNRDLLGRENTRYIVTNLDGTPQHLYEAIYCARGDMENRIKEQQLFLFSDRTSCHDFLANRFR